MNLAKHKVVTRAEERQVIIMSSSYKISEELQQVLLDFTVQYLVEQPEDLASFALVYFTRLKARKPVNHAGNHHSDDSVMSDEEDVGKK